MFSLLDFVMRCLDFAGELHSSFELIEKAQVDGYFWNFRVL